VKLAVPDDGGSHGVFTQAEPSASE
jgi:hypothetical protein